MINLETMKQLLQEFREKEALTTAEIEVVENEINMLEQRIENCRSKLKNYQEDKERLAAMKNRYSTGNVSPTTNTEPGFNFNTASQNNPVVSNPIFSEPVPSQTPIPQHFKSMPSFPEDTDLSGVKTETDIDLPIGSLIQPADTASATNENIEENSDPNANSETIKSINDALKGLFRK